MPGGTFLYITPKQPHFMKPLLAREAWDLSVETLPDRENGVFQYFAYVMKKFGQETDSEEASKSAKQIGSQTGDEQSSNDSAE